MHLRIRFGGEDCGGPNQDRSQSGHLFHLEVVPHRGLHLSETSAAFYARYGSGLSNAYLGRSNLVPTDQLTLSATSAAAATLTDYMVAIRPIAMTAPNMTVMEIASPTVGGPAISRTLR